MIGEKFGKLLVLSKENSDRYGFNYKCKCDCGEEKIIRGSKLKSKEIKSCGCLRSPKQYEYIENLKLRLKKYSEYQGECLIWISKSVYPNFGYGCISYRGKPIAAHRASYLAFIGEIPKGKWVLHKCDNPKCINPNHLFLGTCKDNVIDMTKKGRGINKIGIEHGNSIFNEKDIDNIRYQYYTGMCSINKLRKKYDCSLFAIHSIVTRQTWKHIPDPQLPNMNYLNENELKNIIKNEFGFYTTFAIKTAKISLNLKPIPNFQERD